jgi:hypothetical protein
VPNPQGLLLMMPAGHTVAITAEVGSGADACTGVVAPRNDRRLECERGPDKDRLGDGVGSGSAVHIISIQ